MAEQEEGVLFHLRFFPEWTWTVTPFAMAVPASIYLLVVFLLVKWMKAREAFELRWVIRLYDVAQIVLCAYMTQGFLSLLLDKTPRLESGFPNVFALHLPYSSSGEFFVYVHYWSKILDYLDTVFIALRKKDAQLTLLHVYHHATIAPIWGLLLYLGCASGCCVFGAFLNSFVHVLMYTHYLISSFGINNPFKLVLTQIQILQFYVCILQSIVVVLFDAPPLRYLALIQTVYQVTMVLLFSQFKEQSKKRLRKDD